jgi:DNA uptake protein ComE-like DNA-binding protein
VDLNVAPEHTVAALPGVGPILAKLVVEERAARNGFASVDEFGDVLGLKPHVLERLRGHVFTGPRPVRHRPGRQVDY